MGRDGPGAGREARASTTSRSAASTRAAGRRRSARAGPTGSRASSSDDFWGASCDADEHEEGGLFSKTVLPRAVLAKAHMPDLAQVVPMFNVESIEGAERVEQRASRRKVEFESIEFNRRFLATVPSEYDPVALRELFSPGFLDWAARDRRRGRLRDHRPPAVLPVAAARAHRRRVRGRRSTTPASCSRGCAARWRSTGIHTYPAGPLARGPGAFPDA